MKPSRSAQPRVKRSADEIRSAVTAELNQRWAVVLSTGTTAIVDTSIPGRLHAVSKTAFFDYMAPRKATIPTGRGTREVPVAKIWFEHPDRRTYSGFTFEPGKTDCGDLYNLWRGWPYEPDPTAGEFDVFLDHVRNNVCRGDETRYHWVMSWLADIVQYPNRKLGVALVLRGPQGTGKSTIGDVMGRLLGPYSMPVSHPRYLVGQFNGHLAAQLLLRAEEACWAGDKSAQGILKDLITDPVISIEYKGREAIVIPNFTRVLFTSNEDWVVPAGARDRRFTVLDVSDARIQDHKYFSELWRQLEANDGGGFKALMAFLLEYEIDEAFLRRTLQTEELVEQKLLTLDPISTWWLETLRAGELPGGGGNVAALEDLQRSYLEHARNVGQSHRAVATQLAIYLRKRVPGLRTQVKRVRDKCTGSMRRHTLFIFPNLYECRISFEEELGCEIQWPGSRLDDWHDRSDDDS